MKTQMKKSSKISNILTHFNKTITISQLTFACSKKCGVYLQGGEYIE
jgi:hypothetical protein